MIAAAVLSPFASPGILSTIFFRFSTQKGHMIGRKVDKLLKECKILNTIARNANDYYTQLDFIQLCFDLK